MFKLEKYLEALEAYSTALKIEPNYLDAYINKGSCFKQLQKYNEALEEFDNAIKIKKEYSNGYYNKGGACLPDGKG